MTPSFAAGSACRVRSGVSAGGTHERPTHPRQAGAIERVWASSGPGRTRAGPGPQPRQASLSRAIPAERRLARTTPGPADDTLDVEIYEHWLEVGSRPE